MDEPASRHDPYAALRYADYRRVLTGNVLSALGAELQSAAVMWELFERTNSPAALGYVGLVQFLPVLLLALPAGHAADRFSRRRLYVLAQAFMVFASLGLAALSFAQGPIPLFYLFLTLVGVGRAFLAPVRGALMAQVVDIADLGNAITWNSSGWQVASMVGPALGGFLIAVSRMPSWAYGLTALCGAVSLVLVSSVRPRPYQRLKEPPSLKSLLSGLHFVWQSKLILATLTLDLFAVLFGGATALLPIFARDILEIGPVGYGWLRASPSIGALAMALVLAHRPPLRRAGLTLLLSVAGFGVATIVFGMSRDALLSFTLLALTGALDNISIVVRGTIVHTLTPDEMRGRVSAVNSIFIVSSNELGAFESGLTAAWFGPIISVVGGGIGTLLVVLAVMFRWPEVRRLGPLHGLAEEVPASAATGDSATENSG